MEKEWRNILIMLLGLVGLSLGLGLGFGPYAQPCNG